MRKVTHIPDLGLASLTERLLRCTVLLLAALGLCQVVLGCGAALGLIVRLAAPVTLIGLMPLVFMATIRLVIIIVVLVVVLFCFVGLALVVVDGRVVVAVVGYDRLDLVADRGRGRVHWCVPARDGEEGRRREAASFGLAYATRERLEERGRVGRQSVHCLHGG